MIAAAYFQLIRFDLHLLRGDFAGLYERVRRFPVQSRARQQVAADEICRAVDLASIWYYKPVLCLQRSASITCLLRRHGIDAALVIGAQQLPFRAHAWVEAENRVVSDNISVTNLYVVLDRC
jgi:hypothetical protein